MPKSKEVYQINVEHVLHDVMDIICKYVDGKDLLNVAKVCKSWRYAALREKDKRYLYQQLHLSYKIGNLSNVLHVIPFASLLIYEKSLEKLRTPMIGPLLPWHSDFSNSLEEELLEDFSEQFPNNKAVVFMVDKFLTTEDAEIQGTAEPCDLEPIRNYNILGLFLSSVKRRFRVNVSTISMSEMYHLKPLSLTRHELVISRLAEELGLNHGDQSESAILMFANFRAYNCTEFIIKTLFRRFRREDQNTTFACLFGEKHVAVDCNKEINGNNHQAVVLLKIGGLSVETWSTYIHCLARYDEIERKLQELKKKVKRKRHYIGLIYSFNCIEPRCDHSEHPCGNSPEMMRNLKRVFPFIRFVGLFANCHSSLYTSWGRICADRSDDFFNDGFFFKDLDLYTSIVIVSYD